MRIGRMNINKLVLNGNSFTNLKPSGSGPETAADLQVKEEKTKNVAIFDHRLKPKILNRYHVPRAQKSTPVQVRSASFFGPLLRSSSPPV